MVLTLASALVIRGRSLLLLRRRDHGHWETPGGKLEASDCTDPRSPTRDDLLRCALRELAEEVDCEAEPFGVPLELRFTTPDGRAAHVTKFPMRYRSGSLELREDGFDTARFIDVEDLDAYVLSPDLEEMLDDVRTLMRS